MDKVNPRASTFSYDWLRRRELGYKPPIGLQDQFMKSLYSRIMPCSTWDHNDSLRNSVPGGIFNLEFSPDGSLLVAACEKRNILMFDPLSRKLIHSVDDAHFDCVNCVRFLDSRVFATCSDDSTVALWDARNLRSRIRTLQGHSNWVKNIEFSQSDGLLVTSGFDGSIYTWDINSYTEAGFLYKRVFHTNGLMRTRLNPDGSKMIICTTGGYLILIHDLDLRTLKEDLEGFKPNMYRLMQLSQTTIPVAASYTHLFSPKRRTNRIEFVTDFPDGDDAEVVSSLQVHPQGWCALSRNISNDEHSEWTCIHDIQEPDYSMDSMEEEPDHDTETVPDVEEEEEDMMERMVVIGPNPRSRALNTNTDRRYPDNRHRPFRRTRTGTINPVNPSVNRTSNMPDANRTNGSSPFRGFANANSPFRGWASSDSGRDPNIVVTSTDVWEALVAIREARTRRERNRAHDRRLGGSGILMPDQEPHTRFRIVRMSSGLAVTDVAARARSRGYMDDTMLPVPQQNGVPDGFDIGAHDRYRSTGPATDGISSLDHDRYRARAPVADGVNLLDHDRYRPRALATDVVSSLDHDRYRPTAPATDGVGNSVASIVIRYRRQQSEQGEQAQAPSQDESQPSTSSSPRTILILGSNSNTNGRLRASGCRIKVPKNHKIHQNTPRLSHFIEEPNVGRGFIKELCFSSDGRLICSPFGYGVRLLAFSPECSELSTCVPKKGAVKLYELGTNVCHGDIVVSSKFSPRHCLLVSGCLTGRIVWHQPVV